MGAMWLVAVVLAQSPSGGSAAVKQNEAALAAARDAPTVPAAIDVQSQVGKHFRLVEATVTLDGLDVAHRTASPSQELEHAFRAYDGAVPIGLHTVTVTLVYEGRKVGVFTYLE